jgi:hypothetical protein
MAILKLDPTGGKSAQVQPGMSRIWIATKRLLHKPIHTAASLVLTIGEHGKSVSQLSRSHHIGPIHLPCQWIIHQLHADPVEVLDDQQVVSHRKLIKQLIRANAF